MNVRMSADELRLFSSFLRKARSYVEFGCGGSTYHAAGIGVPDIISVDSSQKWLDQVAGNCAAAQLPTQPRLVFADIGPTGDWGYPVDKSALARWPDYPGIVPRVPGADQADLYLVDGRFRVACFLEVMQRCRTDAIILFHDFASRPHYHVVRKFAREIAVTEDLSAFVPMASYDRHSFAQVQDLVKYDPA